MANAAVMTYDSLVADIQAYMERTDDDFVNQIPRLIMMSEQSIIAAVKTLWETKVVNTQIGQNVYVLQKPARWRKTLSVKSSLPTVNIPGEPLLLRDQTFVAQYANEAPNGAPLYYADWDYDHWMIAPVPDQTYELEIVYMERVEPLDTQNQVNLLTRECPQLLLYCCMMQACLYVKSFEKLQIWKPLYEQELGVLTSEDQRRYIDKNTKREQT